MTEYHNEPLWVGMDVDAELARYTAEEERSEGAIASPSATPKRPPRRRSLRVALPALAKGGSPRRPLAA